MLAPVRSANETPAADATAASTVVAAEATTAAATPCFQTGCRPAAGAISPGMTRVGTTGVGICVVLVITGSVSFAGRSVRPAHISSTNGRARIRQPGKEENSLGWLSYRRDAVRGGDEWRPSGRPRP